MTVSAQSSVPPRMAGLKSHPQEASTQPEEPVMSGFRTNAIRNDKKSSLHEQFNNTDFTEFLKLLAKIYEVPEIKKSDADRLTGFRLDPDKGMQTGEDGKLFAKVGNASVEITKDYTLTDAPITPALAYQLAAAEAAKPNRGKLLLEGTDDDKIMLFFAARQLGLEIEESNVPEIPENIAELATAFHKYEEEMGLRNVAGTYLSPGEKAPSGTVRETPPHTAPAQKSNPTLAFA